MLACVACCTGPVHAAEPPRAALAYRSDLIRTARAVWGLNAPVAVFAAQVHQESGWRPDAVSHAGARGLAQFMPSTSSWIAGIYPALASNDPFNPAWAIRALVQYDLWLYARVQAATPCDRMTFVLSAYNGGLGWVQRDQQLARARGLNPAVWTGNVAAVNAGRSAANWNENRGYPQRILYRHQPLYASWGQGVCL